MSLIRFQLHSIQFKKENGFETYFPYHTIFSLIIGFHLGRHLGYIKSLNDARAASLGFLEDNVITTRINKEKNFKIKFQVLLKFAQIPPDNYPHFKEMVNQICPTEFQLNKTNSSDTETMPFVMEKSIKGVNDFSIINGIVSSNMYDKGDAFDFSNK